MILIHCKHCNDIFNIDFEQKTCTCGISSGVHTNEQSVLIEGNCNAVEFKDESFDMSIFLSETKPYESHYFISNLMAEDHPFVTRIRKPKIIKDGNL